MTEIEVGEYADLDGDSVLSSGQKDAVVSALADNAEAVVWLEDWLRSEKGLEPLEGLGGEGLHPVASVEASTDKAWLLQQPDGGDDWVPKSAARLYCAPGEAEVDASTSPQTSVDKWEGQQGLGDFNG